MIKLFRKTNVESLQRKYDKLMHEAYVLSKTNTEESMKRQKQALEVQQDILSISK
ncbi:Lacal_2735 family protein [Ekhidna sp.]|uniref:Lacal_2735 family protein n=1 Tax=Ekhidna sp. TaxID=2608089 RepID=UPI003B5A057A